jgi:hypothetical protein
MSPFNGSYVVGNCRYDHSYNSRYLENQPNNISIVNNEASCPLNPPRIHLQGIVGFSFAVADLGCILKRSWCWVLVPGMVGARTPIDR